MHQMTLLVTNICPKITQKRATEYPRVRTAAAVSVGYVGLSVARIQTLLLKQEKNPMGVRALRPRLVSHVLRLKSPARYPTLSASRLCGSSKYQRKDSLETLKKI